MGQSKLDKNMQGDVGSEPILEFTHVHVCDVHYYCKFCTSTKSFCNSIWYSSPAEDQYGALMCQHSQSLGAPNQSSAGLEYQLEFPWNQNLD